MSAPQNSNQNQLPTHTSFTNLDTAVVQAGRPPVTPDGPVNPPIVLSSTLHAGGPYGYLREWNATLESLELAIGALEGGQCTTFSSGMAGRRMQFLIYSRKEAQ